MENQKHEPNPDKIRLNKLFALEEKKAEILINRVFLFYVLPAASLLTVSIIIVISLLFGRLDIGALLNMSCVIVLLSYNLIIYFLLKGNKYHFYFKYISILVNVSAFTFLIAGYSIGNGWVHSLRTITVSCYFLVIGLSGFYHNPKIPIYAGFMCSAQYSGLFLFAFLSRKIQFGPSENFYSPTYSMDVFLLYNFALIMSGFIIAYIAKRFRETLDRSLHSEAYSQAMKELDTLKNDFIANITHDFRSPLTIILNTTDLAVRYNERIDQEAKDILDVIYKSSLRLKNTIDKLLELAKIDAEGLKLEIEKTDLTVCLNTLIEYYQSAILSSGIQIVKKLPEHKIDDFYTDMEKLEEILDNILSNAVKFVDPQTGVITIELTELDHEVLITISDNGIGIPKDKLNSVFKRFEQVHAGRDRLNTGTGIGLAFSKQLTEYLKGKIWAESEGEGKGSRFFIKLKKGKGHFAEKDFGCESGLIFKKKNIKTLIEAELEEKMQKENVETIFSDLNKENEADYKKGVILVIDDDKYIRKIIVNYLNNSGFKNFIIASDGNQGLDAVYEYQPDIIISDYYMPNMNGDDLHNQMLDNPKHKEIPFVFLSAVVDEKLMLERREIGAVAFLKKPIEEKILIITVEEQLKKYFEYKKIMLLATVDELTGLNNRRTIIENLNRELAIRNYRDLAVLFFDIDNFKNINDSYGHQAGDLILSTMGKTIKEFIRKYDVAGRYGGDEFIVVLPETSLNNAIRAAEALGKAIRDRGVYYQGKKLSISASFGVSSLKDHQNHIIKTLGIKSLEEIYEVYNRDSADWEKIEKLKGKISEVFLKMADEALYRAKTTTCRECGFGSEKKILFANDKCPKCGSSELELGRNKVVGF